MSSLTLVVTQAGRAALVNAQNNGTAPVLMAQVGVTATAFTATDTLEALPGELKRLDTFAGAAVADDTIHVTIRDDTTDVYSCRGFALYLDDGTLFASYGQADPIGEKSAQSMFLLALDAIFTDIAATSLTFGDTDFLLSSATTSQQGIVELATDAEAAAGTDVQRAVVPHALKAALDARFGDGAPSTFVKALLTAATAAVFRTALAIKSAALYDTGSGKGLDADLLDGQHGSYYRAWANLTGVPTSFPPSSHTHTWNQITGAPAYATRWADWTEVTNKPTTFPPAAHSQDWSTINGKPDTATRWPAWSEVTGKPAFQPVAFSGVYGDLTGRPTLGSAAAKNIGDFASAEQGAKADSAAQPNSIVVFSQLKVSGPSTTNQLLSWCDETGPALWALYTFTGTNRDLNLARYGDDGLNKGSVMTASRSTGAVSFPGGVSAPNLGTASEKDIGDFATAAQGVKADAAMPRSGGTFTGAITAPSYDSPASSRAAKQDIAPCRYGLSEFMRIPWVEYRYNDSVPNDGRLRFGSIVEDVEPIAPLLVIRRPGRIPTFEYDQFIPVIGRALQQYIAQADARAAAAEAKVAALADRVAQLEARA